MVTRNCIIRLRILYLWFHYSVKINPNRTKIYKVNKHRYKEFFVLNETITENKPRNSQLHNNFRNHNIHMINHEKYCITTTAIAYITTTKLECQCFS